MSLWKLANCVVPQRLPMLPNDIYSKSLNELLILQTVCLQQVNQARDELDGEYAFNLYCLIVQRIHELVDQSPVGRTG